MKIFMKCHMQMLMTCNIFKIKIYRITNLENSKENYQNKVKVKFQ